MQISPSSTLSDARLVPRRISRRVVFIGFMALPLLLLFGAVVQPAGALYLVVPALIIAAPLALAIAYEHTYRLWVSNEAVEVRALGLTGMKQTSMRFDEIERLFVTTVDPSQGGSSLVEAGAELLDKLTRKEGTRLNELTHQITVTLHGAGKKVKLTNGNKGIAEVAKLIVDNTTARLQTEVLDALDRGDSVPFGPYTLAPAGVLWRSTLIGWSEIETFTVDDDGGKLMLKKHGAWLATANPSAAKVPNLDVLLAVVDEKRSSSMV